MIFLLCCMQPGKRLDRQPSLVVVHGGLDLLVEGEPRRQPVVVLRRQDRPLVRAHLVLHAAEALLLPDADRVPGFFGRELGYRAV